MYSRRPILCFPPGLRGSQIVVVRVGAGLSGSIGIRLRHWDYVGLWLVAFCRSVKLGTALACQGLCCRWSGRPRRPLEGRLLRWLVMCLVVKLAVLVEGLKLIILETIFVDILTLQV